MKVRRAAFAALCCLGLLLPVPVRGTTLRTITLDGNVSDWAEVLVDPDNVVADQAATADPADPDQPANADRDIRAFAATWDGTNLYFFVRRTRTGTNSFHFLIYVDRDHDGTMQSTDRVVRYKYNGAALGDSAIYAYQPANPSGDPLTGDGQDMPGTLGSQLAGTPPGANSQNGIEFEMAVSWATLGVVPGRCLNLRSAISRATNLPSSLEDNADPLDTRILAWVLRPDRSGSSGSPGQVDYGHELCNQGNCNDLANLSFLSSQSFDIQLWTDPNGDGDPADGAEVGRDRKGDGDFDDDQDFLDPASDTDGDGFPDTGSLGAGLCRRYVVRVGIPPGVEDGREEQTRVRARPASRPGSPAVATDRTVVGWVTLAFDDSRTGVAGDTVDFPQTACNNQPAADVLDLSAASAAGWPVEYWTDPDGDGDPSDGAPVTAVGPLAAGSCLPLVLRLSVPAGTPPGVTDSVEGSAASRSDPTRAGSVADTARVAASRFEVAPDRSRDAEPGNTLFFAHRLTNNGSARDSFDLTATPSDPTYTVTLLTDPDGDGQPDNSTVITGPVGPVRGNGGTYTFLARVRVPAGAAYPDVKTVNVAARSALDPTEARAATDTIRIQVLLTYSDPIFARPSTVFFASCATVHAQGHGLDTNRTYRFVWSDPAGAVQRLSPEGKPDALGRLDDSFALPCGGAPGTWRVKIQIKEGSSWTDVPSGAASFTLLDDAGGEGGEIASLLTNRQVYGILGYPVAVNALMLNATQADYEETAVEYRIFRDDDGNRRPTAGEPFIRADGARAPWDGTEATHRTDIEQLRSGRSFDDIWKVQDVEFQEVGTWCVHAEWFTLCGSGSCSRTMVDEALRCFEVGCVPIPLVEAGADKATCQGLPAALSDAEVEDGENPSWDDAGAGGTFQPGPDVLNPDYTHGTPGAYLLTLVATHPLNGCPASDSLLVTVNENPVADAGPALQTCAGVPVDVSGADATLADIFLWDDRGAGGTFLPGAQVLRPSYLQAAPGLYDLDLTATVGATGCVDTSATQVQVHANPTAEAGPDRALTCAVTEVVLEGSASGGDGSQGYLYEWTPAAGLDDPASPTPTASAPGTYTLTVTTVATGCTATDTVTVGENRTPPVAEAGPDKDLTCLVTGVRLEGSASGGDGSQGYAYAWAPAAGLDDPASPTPTASAPGTYTLTATDRANGCVAEDTVEVHDLTASPQITAGPERDIACDALAVAIRTSVSGTDGRDGYLYDWTPPAGLDDPSAAEPLASAAGTFQVTVTDAYTGCSATASAAVAYASSVFPVAPGAGEPLRVRKAGGGTTLDVRWERSAGGLFNLYEGTLDGLHSGGYDHAAFGFCGLADPQASFPLPSGRLYFLATARSCVVALGESGYGVASDTTPRPDAATASGVACP